jgi:hypothetical protein
VEFADAGTAKTWTGRRPAFVVCCCSLALEVGVAVEEKGGVADLLFVFPLETHVFGI